MESDGVVFIDGSLIEDGALERRRPRRRRQLLSDGDIAATAKDRTRVGGLTRRNDVKRAAADYN